MKITLKVKNALYDAKAKRLVMHGNARKTGFFAEGYGEFRIELIGDEIRKIALLNNLSDSLTPVQILRSFMDKDAEIQFEL